MYNENGFSVRSFIVKVILVVLFVFLLMWLFPTANIDSINERLFAENMEQMRDAAKSYFTVDRLPSKENQTIKITLDDMLDLKLLLPLYDDDGKLCDQEKSYVEVTKTKDEYLIKVKLTCGGKSDYIVEHFGCYDICSNKCTEEVKQEEAKAPVKTTTTKPTTTKPTPTPTKPETKPDPKPETKPDPKPDPKPTVQYEYQYSKNLYSSYSYWTDWSSPIAIKNGETITFGVVSTSNGTVENENLGAKEEVVGYDIYWKTTESKTVTRNVNYTLGSYTITACSEYSYERDNTTSETYRASWSTPVLDSTHYSMPPSDTTTKKYSNIQVHYDLCTDSCGTDKIYYTAYVSYLTKTKIVGSATSGIIDSGCSALSSKTVYIKGTVSQTNTVPTKVVKVLDPRYATIKYYRQRKYVSGGSTSTDYKWSSSKTDATLLNQGYALTGATRQK